MKNNALFAVAAAVAFVLPSAPLSAQAATWKIDPVHSELTFRVRHFVTKVRGTFAKWEGTIVADPSALDRGSVNVTIDTKSVDTNEERRDTHLRSPDFFAVDSFPTMTFKSTKVEVSGSDLKVHGDLTIRGITKPVVLSGEYGGTTKGSDGKDRIGFEVSTKINRLDHKVSWNRAVEGGGAVLADEVEINITIEAIRQP